MTDMELCLCHDGVGVLQPAGDHEFDGCINLPAELQVCSAFISLGHEIQIPLGHSPQVCIAACSPQQLSAMPLIPPTTALEANQRMPGMPESSAMTSVWLHGGTACIVSFARHEAEHE